MSKRQKLTKYGTLLGGYSIGVFLNQAINLILIPIFWKILTPEDFGIIAVTQIISLLLSPVYLFGASETIQQFYYRWTEEERPHFLGWYFWFVFVFTLLLTLFLDFMGSHFSQYVIVNVEYSPLLRYALWSTFFVNFINFPVAISRIKQKVLAYNILMNGSFLTQIGIVLYLVKTENLGALGYIKGFFIANAIWFLPSLFLTFKDAAIFPSKKYFYVPFDYAAPLSFAGLIEGFSAILDRYYLDKYLPLATIGFYNLARQLGSVVNVINSVTKLMFVPYIYKINAIKNNAATILADFSIVYGVLMTVPVIAVCTLGREFVTIFDPSGVYMPLVEYIPAFAVSFYFFSLAMAMGRGMDLAGVTKWIFLVPLTGIIVSLTTYETLLPEHGIWAILASLVAGSFARNFLNIVLSVYFFPRKLFINKLALAWGISILFYIALFQLSLQDPWLSGLLKLALLLILGAIHIRFIVYSNLLDILSPVNTKKEST